MKASIIILLISFVSCRSGDRPPKPSPNWSPEIEVEETVQSQIDTIDFDTSIWTELLPSEHIKLDIRYATDNNFTNQVIYPCGRCFLRKESAIVLLNIVEYLKINGYGIKLFDCYRPAPAQQKLWDIVPNPMYVADPAKGSMHNRGLAVDLTFTDLKGNELDMGTAYDFFGRKAYHDFTDLPEDVLKRRIFLKETMAQFGFTHTRTEWWHYSDQKNKGEISHFEWSCPQ